MVKSKFLKINCPRCGAPRVIFGKSSLRIKCERCNYLLTMTTGGKTRVRAKVKEIYDAKRR